MKKPREEIAVCGAKEFWTMTFSRNELEALDRVLSSCQKMDFGEETSAFIEATLDRILCLQQGACAFSREGGETEPYTRAVETD